MSFADPQSVTIAGVATSLPRISTGVNTSTYSSADGSIRETVASTYGRRTRRTLRLNHSKLYADPLNPAVSKPANMVVYIVVDAPTEGYTIAQQKEVVDGYLTILTASTGANITRLLGGEN